MSMCLAKAMCITMAGNQILFERWNTWFAVKLYKLLLYDLIFCAVAIQDKLMCTLLSLKTY